MSFWNKGISLFHKYVKNKFVRFILVGGLNTLFGYSIYCLMLLIGLSFVWATLVSQVLGVLFNFMTTGTLVFENSNPKLLFMFVMCYVVTYFINIGTNKLLQDVTGLNKYVTGVGATIIAALCSFFILKTFVYGRKEKTD